MGLSLLAKPVVARQNPVRIGRHTVLYTAHSDKRETRMARFGIIAGMALVAAVAQPARATEDAPACTAAGALPADLAAWSMLAYHDAATSTAGLAAARLTMGETARMALVAATRVTYPVRLTKPATADTFGGLMQIVVPARGNYRVVLGSHAWISLIAADGKVVEASAHAMGPACTGIRKMVDFTLTPGNYTLQLSDNPEPATSVLVIRRP